MWLQLHVTLFFFSSSSAQELLSFTTEGDYDYLDLMCDRESVRLFRSRYEPPLFWLIALVGGAGNLAVMWTYLKQRLKTLTEVYLLHLAVADLLFLVTLPLWAVEAQGGWTFGSALCKMTAAVYKVNLFSSTLLLTCISLDRYVVIVHATKASSSPQERRRRSLLLCGGVWLLALLLAIPELLFATTAAAGDSQQYCRMVFPNDLGNQTKILTLALQVSMGFCLPFAIMAVCYGVILARLLRTKNFQKHKAMRVVLAVVLVFLLTQLPYNGVLVAEALQASEPGQSSCEELKRLDLLKQLLMSLAYLHAALNPVLYAFVGVRFRRELMKLLCVRRQRAANQKQWSKSCRSPPTSRASVMSDSDTSQHLSL